MTIPDPVSGLPIEQTWGQAVAAQLNDSWDRTIWGFATKADRDTQWPTPAPGAMAMITGGADGGTLSIMYGGWIDVFDADVGGNITFGNGQINRFAGDIETGDDIHCDGDVYLPNMVTAGASTAVHISAADRLYKSSSSSRYKVDVEDMDPAAADNVIDNLRPVWYRSNPDTTDELDPDWSWWGLIAEEVEAVDPRLVGYHYDRHVQEPVVGADGNPMVDGAGNPVTRTVVAPDAELIAESVHYDRIVVHLIDKVRRQQAQIDDLVARVAALEGA